MESRVQLMDSALFKNSCLDMAVLSLHRVWTKVIVDLIWYGCSSTCWDWSFFSDCKGKDIQCILLYLKVKFEWYCKHKECQIPENTYELTQNWYSYQNNLWWAIGIAYATILFSIIKFVQSLLSCSPVSCVKLVSCDWVVWMFCVVWESHVMLLI